MELIASYDDICAGYGGWRADLFLYGASHLSRMR